MSAGLLEACTSMCVPVYSCSDIKYQKRDTLAIHVLQRNMQPDNFYRFRRASNMATTVAERIEKSGKLRFVCMLLNYHKRTAFHFIVGSNIIA